MVVSCYWTIFFNSYLHGHILNMKKRSFQRNIRFFAVFWVRISLADVTKIYIDSCALSDPYLSRIPAIKNEGWRIGHHARKIPAEFGLYRIGTIDQIPDKSLQRLFNDVSLIVKGEIFTSQRFIAIWNLLTDNYSEIDVQKYSVPTIWIPSNKSN